MAKQPIINGKVVERSYEDYRNNQYLVNRRYQRKLVWELDEKQAFIDSLANRQIGAKMRHVNYHGKSVIILRIACNNGPAIFDGAYYTRSGPSNDPVSVKAEEMPAFFAQFT